MGDQETNFLRDEDSICRSMLNLSTVSDKQSTSATPDAFPTVCICSAKRQSPLSQSLVQEPAPKRATLHPPSSPFAAAEDHELLGYKKLPLPPFFHSAPLRRTLSEPIYSPGTADSAAPPPQLLEFPTSPSPINTQPHQDICNQEAYPLLKPSPLLYCTVSDPNPAFNLKMVATAGTPPRPPSRRNPSRSPSFGESPNARVSFSL